MAMYPTPSAEFRQRLLRVSQQPQHLPEPVLGISDIWSYLWPRLTLASASLCVVLFVCSWVFMSGALDAHLYDSQSFFVSTVVNQDVGDMLVGWNQL